MPADLPKDKLQQKAIIEKVGENLSNLQAGDIVNLLAKVKPGSLDSYQPLFIADNIE